MAGLRVMMSWLSAADRSGFQGPAAFGAISCKATYCRCGLHISISTRAGPGIPAKATTRTDAAAEGGARERKRERAQGIHSSAGERWGTRCTGAAWGRARAEPGPGGPGHVQGHYIIAPHIVGAAHTHRAGHRHHRRHCRHCSSLPRLACLPLPSSHFSFLVAAAVVWPSFSRSTP